MMPLKRVAAFRRLTVVGLSLILSGYFFICLVHCQTQSVAVAAEYSGHSQDCHSDENSNDNPGRSDAAACCADDLTAYQQKQDRPAPSAAVRMLQDLPAVQAVDVNPALDGVANLARLPTDSPSPPLAILLTTLSLRAPPLV